MNWKTEWKTLALIAAVFLVLFYLPVDSTRFDAAMMEALHLAKWYAQEHVLLCLLPAFFIAGAISVFVNQAAVMKYLGAGANKVLAYSVAATSGTILAVCSCTVLPLFAGIYRMGAGLGPASAFLYSGPAINVLAIILTARILGVELGIARAVGAIIFSVVIGLMMHFIFRKEEMARADAAAQLPDDEPVRPLWQTAIFFAAMIAVLVFANWGKPEQATGIWHAIYSAKWYLTATFGVGLAVVLVVWFGLSLARIGLAVAPALVLSLVFPKEPMLPFAAATIGLAAALGLPGPGAGGESSQWLGASWTFTKQMMPLLLAGVLVAGALLGRPDHEGLVPSQWVADLVGGNSIWANLFASVVGAFMYFATLTEVPILEGLIDNGMGKGPALALLLAGPALSLPNMLVIRSIMGTRKTIVFVALVVAMATISGVVYGALFDQPRISA